MKTISVIIGVLLVIYGCEKDRVNRNFEDDPSITEISGMWRVDSYEDFVNNTITEKSDVDSGNGMNVVLTFTLDSLYGRNTTNAVYGNFTISGRTINIIRYGGTKFGQPEWGNLFSDAVIHFQRFEINKFQLRFFYNDNQNSVNLEALKR